MSNCHTDHFSLENFLLQFYHSIFSHYARIDQTIGWSKAALVASLGRLLSVYTRLNKCYQISSNNASISKCQTKHKLVKENTVIIGSIERDSTWTNKSRVFADLTTFTKLSSHQNWLKNLLIPLCWSSSISSLSSSSLSSIIAASSFAGYLSTQPVQPNRQ